MTTTHFGPHNPITMDTPVQTRDGATVRLLCIDAPGPRPICGLIETEEGVSFLGRWTTRGAFTLDPHFKSANDLIPVKRKLSGFINVYPCDDDIYGLMYFERREAADSYGGPRLACIDLSQFHEGHGLD